MGTKGLTKHAEGRARQPTPLPEVNNVPMSRADPTVAATEVEIESAEKKLDDYERNEAHAKHIILSTTSPCLSLKIKHFATVKEMWDAVLVDVSNKSTLQQIDILEQLQEMHCGENADADAHLLEITEHFCLMEEHRDQLATMGSPVGEAGFLALVLKSVPASYRPTVQTIDTNSILTSRASTTPNATPTTISTSDVIALFIREARHRALQQTREKGGAVMFAGSGVGQKSSNGKSKGGGKSGKGKGAKPKGDATCYNCGKLGHFKADCYTEGGGKAGQGPHQKSAKKGSAKEIG